MKLFVLPLLVMGSLVFGAVAPAGAEVPREVHASASTTVSARALLAKLTVAAPDRKHRYSRDVFGYDVGADADGDGCTTRKEVLIRDHLGPVRVSASCAVSGSWKSLYDNRITSTPSRLEIDHLVPLAEAWHAGAWAWGHARQVAFGNDLGYKWDLQPVTASLNQDKGDKDPARWMPRANRCTYVKAWIAVKYRWSLTVDTKERTALRRALAHCRSVEVLRPGKPDLAKLTGTGSSGTSIVAPSSSPTATTAPAVTAAPTDATPISPVVPAPANSPMPTSVPVVTPTPAATATAMPISSPSASPAPSDVVYANCAAVRSAGRAPLYRGQPGYSSKLDRDGDGVACES